MGQKRNDMRTLIFLIFPLFSFAQVSYTSTTQLHSTLEGNSVVSEKRFKENKRVTFVDEFHILNLGDRFYSLQPDKALSKAMEGCEGPALAFRFDGGTVVFYPEVMMTFIYEFGKKYIYAYVYEP